MVFVEFVKIYAYDVIDCANLLSYINKSRNKQPNLIKRRKNSVGKSKNIQGVTCSVSPFGHFRQQRDG